ncbi:MAG: 50S ribosomal protein L21 [bacterium]
MFAIVNIAGQQLKVEENKKYYVNRLPNELNTDVVFDKVLILSDGEETKVGAPTVEGATVSAKVIEHLKDDKVIVFKKKRRKSYRVKNGHRSFLTKIEVTKIG